MPEEFNKCVKSGGRVRTKTLSGGRYIHICYKDGESYSGEVKSKDKSLSSSLKKAHKGEK